MASEEPEPEDFELADFEPAERVLALELQIGLAQSAFERAWRLPSPNFPDCAS